MREALKGGRRNMDPFLEKRLEELSGAREDVRLAGGREKGSKHHAEGKLREYREIYASPILEINSNLNVVDGIIPAETRRYLFRAFRLLE
jgi:hypothetical protein